MTVHDLKCIEPWFEYCCSGAKPFEVRKNDRDFKKGDIITLHQFDPHQPKAAGNGYTGRSASFEITIVLDYEDAKGIQAGYVVLGLKEFEP